jgi:co-chaperonin GroES (HSP10)
MPSSIRPIRDKVLVVNIESGGKVTSGGIIIPDDDGKERGIRPRWAEVYAVGSDISDIKPGQWILISHGRWSRGVNVDTPDGKIVLRQIDYPDAVLLVSDKKP